MFFKAKDMLIKAKKEKNGNHPTILSRWKADEEYRKSVQIVLENTTIQLRNLNEYEIQSIGLSR